MELLVVADDRTGAFETAAVVADHGAGAVAVTAWPDLAASDASNRVGVVDLDTRHIDPREARSRIASLPAPRRVAHKIDSTLRGNWPHELAEWSARRPVLVVAALPALGRVCVDGVVLEHGRPVNEGSAGIDARRAVTSSRPADLLVAADASDVTSVSTAGDLDAWFRRPTGICVADAATSCEVERIVRTWAPHTEVVLAGTSAVTGGSATTLAIGAPAFVPHPVTAPVLVVCGSLHPAARAQVDHAASQGIAVCDAGDPLSVLQPLRESAVAVLTSEVPAAPIDGRQATQAARRLRAAVAAVHRRVELGALVVLGGDTAAAIVGAVPATVHGSVAPGTAWATVPDREHPVITRAGGFGDTGALVDLVRQVCGR